MNRAHDYDRLVARLITDFRVVVFAVVDLGRPRDELILWKPALLGTHFLGTNRATVRASQMIVRRLLERAVIGTNDRHV